MQYVLTHATVCRHATSYLVASHTCTSSVLQRLWSLAAAAPVGHWLGHPLVPSVLHAYEDGRSIFACPHVAATFCGFYLLTLLRLQISAKRVWDLYLRPREKANQSRKKTVQEPGTTDFIPGMRKLYIYIYIYIPEKALACCAHQCPTSRLS